LTTQKRENHGEYNRVCQGGLEAGLTRLKDATRTWGESEEKPRAQREEEHSGYDEVGPGEHETHSLGDETVHEEEHEGVEEDRHLVCFAVHEADLGPIGGQKNTWAERQKKGGGDSDFLGSDIGEHLIYAHIFFRKVDKVVEGGTAHHLFVESIIVDDSSQFFPDVVK
jgi:hypothetical protein